MIKKFFISIGVLFSFFLMFLFGFDKINVLAINSFDSSIGSYNFTIDIDNYDNINLFEYPNYNVTLSSGDWKWQYINSDLMPNFEIGKTYTIKAYFEDIGNFGCQVQNMNYAPFCGVNSDGSLRKFTFTYNGTSPYLRLGNDHLNVDVNNYKIYLMIVEGNAIPEYYSSYFKFGYNVNGKISILSTANDRERDFTLTLCNRLARYDGNGYLIDSGNCFYVISDTISSIGVHTYNIDTFIPFDVSDDGVISFDMEFYVLYSGYYYPDMYLCPYSDYNSNASCSSSDNSLIFTPILEGYYKGEPSNNIIHSKMNYVSNNFYYKGFYLYGRGRYFNNSTNSYNYFDSKEFINFISNDVKTGANLELNSSINEEIWSINTNVASDYIKSTSYYNAININDFFNYSIDMSKFFEHNSHFTEGTATGVATINDYTMFWGFSSFNTRVLDSNSSSTPIPGGEDISNKYNSCSAWYDIPCQLGNAVTYVIYEAPIISPVLTFIVSFITMFSSLVSFVDLFKSFGIVFGCFIIYMFIELLHKYSK